MWQKLALFVLKNKWLLMGALLAATVFMGYQASRVKLSYEFSKAIPASNPYYKDFVQFKEKFGEDGNVLVIGIKDPELFTMVHYSAYKAMADSIRSLDAVTEVVGIPTSVALQKDPFTEKLTAYRIFPDSSITSEDLEAAKTTFLNLPFYKGLLHNPETNAYLMGVRINKDVMATPARSELVKNISAYARQYETKTGVQVHLSGLPLIRTLIADKVQKEMKFFLLGSLLFSVLILLIFFRSISSVLISLAVVAVGVIFAIGTIQLCGYKITLLTALIPSLVVVIGIPNCIYFFNKYHTAIEDGIPKKQALVEMVSKMGVVTLFCNITAAIGFAVFALTDSQILVEFGVVAGISIFFIFIISFILLPGLLSIVAVPGKQQLQYLHTKWINNLVEKLVIWVSYKSKMVLAVTGILLLFAIIGITRLNNVAFIVDDLPKTDIVYKDLKFFESNFNGVMPLEMLIDTRKPKGILNPKISIQTIAKFQDSVLSRFPEIGKPLSVVDGVKFSYQALSEGEGETTYALPSFGNPLADLHKSIRKLQIKQQENTMDAADTAMLKIMGSFVDSTEQYIRMSMSMKDVGTKRLTVILDSLKKAASDIFGSAYKVSFTGSSITFLEGSKYIVNGLKESILWAFGLIALCMIYLFKSWRILLCSLLPNLIPLIFTAGIMGWTGVPIKPSTVLVFSVALGIAVDITIRFLVYYKQSLRDSGISQDVAVINTIKKTALSIIYTSIVLVAGFIIFCASSFGGTFALGWLTSVTLLIATFTNLVLLPVLLKIFLVKTKP